MSTAKTSPTEQPGLALCCKLAIATQNDPIDNGKRLQCGGCRRWLQFSKIAGWIYLRPERSISSNEPPAPRAGERERVILNSDLVVRPMPNTLLKTKYLLTTDDDWPVAEFYREEEAEGIAYEHNQYAILIEQRDRLFIAAKFLLAMNTTNYDRDAMRSEGGFDALQKAVDYAIEQSRNSATTIEREGV